MNPLIYLNGTWRPLDEARVSVTDHGFLYGAGLFETMRAYAGQPFRLTAHLERLAQGAAVLGLNRPPSPDELAETVRQAVAVNHLTEATVRLMVTFGPGALAPRPESCREPTVFVAALPLRRYPDEAYARGFRAVTVSFRRNETSPLCRLKSNNFLENILARTEAQRAGADEGLWLNTRGLVCEGTISNVFLVRDGELFTPHEGCGLLPGITRRIVLDLAAQSGLKAQEAEVTPKDLRTADEAFLTNSLLELMPLTEIDGQPVGSGRPGAVTQKLQGWYREVVEGEL